MTTLETTRILAALAVAAGCLPSSATAQTLTLRDALATALESHPAARAAEANVDAAESGAAAARADRLPGLSLTTTMTRFEEPMVVAPFHSLDFSRPPTFDRTLVQAQATLGYTLFDGGARSARMAGADAFVEAAGFGVAATRIALIERVTNAYLAVLSAREVGDAAGSFLVALEAERDRARRHVDAGTAARVELLRANAALEDARAGVATAEARVRLAERSLARLMGVAPTAVRGARLEDLVARPGVERPPTGADRDNPALDRAERSVRAAAAGLAEARAARFPRIDVGAGLLDFGTLGGGHVTEWQAGVRLSWPLFTGGGRRAGIQRAEANVRIATEELGLAELEVSAAVDAAGAALAEADARAEALEASVAQWQEVLRIEALALDAGSGVQSDLLRATASLFQARAGHARARYDAVAARVALAGARGELDEAWLTDTLEIRR